MLCYRHAREQGVKLRTDAQRVADLTSGTVTRHVPGIFQPHPTFSMLVVMSCPLTLAEPVVGGYRPTSMDNVVVLPAPL